MIHMEGNKGGGGGGGRVVGGGEDDMSSDGIMHCINHPHRNNNNAGGICAFCLQEKLGKLVSSSSHLPIRPSSSSPSSSSLSFRSDTASSSATITQYPSANSFASKLTSQPAATSSSSSSSSHAKKNGTDHHHHYHEHYMRSRLPFLLPKKNKKKKPISANSSSSSSAAATSDMIFKRSKSTATPRRRGQFLDDAEEEDDIVNKDFNFISPRKRNWFWSFLYLSSKPSSSSVFSSTKKFDARSFRESSPRISAVNAASCTSRDKCSSFGSSSLGRKSDMVVEEEGDSAPASASSSLERKVSRSRSVGCGSKSFSGDFFERISTGLGDCTLRRVESQREGKTKVAAAVNRGGDHHHHHHCMKERVMCGGIFSGFMMTSSSSSSSSSYWVSSSSADDHGMNNGESVGVALPHGRGRSWGWAFASPMRAFGSKTSSKDNKRDNIRGASDKNSTPNLSAIPSLLTVSS